MNANKITTIMNRNKVLIIAFWIVFGSFITIAYAPDLLSSTDTDFKAPDGSDSAKAELLMKTYFPEQINNSEHIILFNNPEGNVLSQNMIDVSMSIADFVLEKYPDAEVFGYAMVVGTELDSLKSNFVSEDGKSSIMTISVPGTNNEQLDFVEALRDEIRGLDSENDIYVVGRPALDRDTDHSIERDMSTIDAIVIPIVFLALILLLRNWKYLPITVIPIFLSIGTSFGILERYIALTGNAIQAFVPSVLISMVLGIGVDYNLFLLSRFKEERKSGSDVFSAVETMMERAGHTVLTSGGTLILAMAGLTFFPVVMLSSVGVGISIAITILLLINLTFTPSLLLLVGKWVEKRENREVKKIGSKFWYRMGKFSTKYSLGIIALILLITAPIIANMIDFEAESQTVFFSPNGSESNKGLSILQDSFGQGMIGPLSIVVVPEGGSVMSEDVFDSTRRLANRLIDELGVDPFAIQSHAWLNGSAIDFDFAMAAFDPTSPIFNIPQAALYRVFASPLMSDDLVAMRIGLTIDEDVWSPEAMAQGEMIKKIVSEEFNGDETGVYGDTTIGDDVIDSTMNMFPLMILGVVLVIYIFIAIMFRAVFLPLRLIATIGLTLAFIFGATTLVFQDQTFLNDLIPLLNDMEVTFWMVPVMSFSIILGLGIDYDVFTLERIRENLSNGMSNEEAIASGISKTSRIITSAGIIMMIAFGGLMFSSSYILVQFGFVLTFSVFLDTFVVRSILVPAIMSIGEKWNWWPSTIHEVSTGSD